MRTMQIVGVVLIAVGGFLFVQGGTFSTSEEVLKVGDLKVSAKEQHTVAPWMAGVAVIAGIALIATGASRKS